MEDGSREAHRTGNGKAATGPPVTAERYKKEISVPGEVSAVKRKRKEVVPRVSACLLGDEKTVFFVYGAVLFRNKNFWLCVTVSAPGAEGFRRC